MNKKMFVQLCINFNKEPNEMLYDLWKEELDGYDVRYINKAIKKIILEDRYMPNLNRVIEVLNNLEYIYITEEEKLLKMSEIGVKPDWVDKKIINEPIDEETKKEFEVFKTFIEELENGQRL